MAMTSDFSRGRMEKETQLQVDALYERILASFIRAGEKFVTAAREQMQDHAMGTYKDQTTNLRNSIGYHIYLDGKLVHYNMGRVVLNKSDVEHLVKPKGIQLIGFAGMEYASHVESKGYNVISYQADLCMVDLGYYLETLEVNEKGSTAVLEGTFVPDELPDNFVVR